MPLTNNSDLYTAIDTFIDFTNNQSLTKTISRLEEDLKGANRISLELVVLQENIDKNMLEAILLVKKSISQINVFIHAIGIINSLNYILEEDEVIEYLSLGAGNTGRQFDVETNKRIAEFKFINWSGKSNTIRQNSTFKDFFELVEYETEKKRFLYILDKAKVLNFLNGNRALSSVLSKNEATRKHFYNLYNSKYITTAQYYNDKKHLVEIVDLNEMCADLFD